MPINLPLKRGSSAIFGILICTPALMPVPRLDGQVRMNPRCSFHMNSLPADFIASSTLLSPLQNLVNTCRERQRGHVTGQHETTPTVTTNTIEYINSNSFILELHFTTLLHVSIALHGDYTAVIFFIDPNQEVLGLVVPDTSCLWPITVHTRGSE